MARYEIPLNSEPLSDLLTDDKGLQGLVETGLNQVLEAQVTEQLGARPYARSATRKASRNGSRARTLTTRVGPLVLHVPQVRDGRCSTPLFARSQRSEQAVSLALMEMGRTGVSTRQGTALTEPLCGPRFARSTVSHLGLALEARVPAWHERPCGSQAYPFVIVDALVVNGRRDEAVRATSALLVAGINEPGMREGLGRGGGIAHPRARGRMWLPGCSGAADAAWRCSSRTTMPGS